MEKSKKPTLNTLRDHLFQQLDKLNDPNANQEIELKKANAMIGIGNVLVNSAKAEVEFMKATGNRNSSGFIGQQKVLENGD